jgi:hypothetical protein
VIQHEVPSAPAHPDLSIVDAEIEGNKFVKQGCWDSIHVVEVRNESASKAVYKLTTTIMLSMSVDKSVVGDTNLSGSLTRQVKAIYTSQLLLLFLGTHLVYLRTGRAIERCQ